MRYVVDLLRITIGCVIQAFTLNALIIPSHLLSGGLTGISIILFHLFALPVSVTYFVMNIPLLLIGYKHLGRKFVFYTMFAICVFSGSLELIHFHRTWTNDPWLAVLFGGVLSSFGGAMVLRSGGSSGGLDIPARLVAKYTTMSMGRFNIVVNAIIVCASLYLFPVELAMYTLVFIFISGVAYDRWFLTHHDQISVRIVTDKGEEVVRRIHHELGRGVTKLEGQGSYTNHQKQVLICVIVREQLYELIHLLQEVDENVFADATQSVAVVGRFQKER